MSVSRLCSLACFLLLVQKSSMLYAASSGNSSGSAWRTEGELDVGYGVDHLDDGGFENAERFVGGQLKIRPDSDSLFLLDGYVKNKPVISINGEQILSDRETDTTISQLYYSKRFDGDYKLTVGRQRLLWGHGFAYVPTDFINPPLDPSALDIANRKGVDSISFDIFQRRTTYTFLINLDKNNERPGVGFKLTNSSIAGLDVNVVYYFAKETGNAAGFSFSADPLSWMHIGAGEFTVIGNFSVKERSVYHQLDDVQTENGTHYVAVGPVIDDQQGNIFSSLVGGAYELPQYRFSFRAEYYFIGDAYDKADLEKIYTGISPHSPEFVFYKPWTDVLSTGRNQHHYVSLSVGQDKITEATGNKFSDTFGYSLAFLQGREDKSRLFSVALTSTYFDGIELTSNWFFPTGNAHTEFGSIGYSYLVDVGIKIAF